MKNLKGKQEIKNLKASFSKEGEVILGNLFVDLSLKYKDEYENNGINRLYKEIEGLNVKSEGQLKDFSLKEYFILKFNNF